MYNYELKFYWILEYTQKCLHLVTQKQRLIRYLILLVSCNIMQVIKFKCLVKRIS
jgi:hypothetical protein